MSSEKSKADKALTLAGWIAVGLILHNFIKRPIHSMFMLLSIVPVAAIMYWGVTVGLGWVPEMTYPAWYAVSLLIWGGSASRTIDTHFAGLVPMKPMFAKPDEPRKSLARPLGAILGIMVVALIIFAFVDEAARNKAAAAAAERTVVQEAPRGYTKPIILLF